MSSVHVHLDEIDSARSLEDLSSACSILVDSSEWDGFAVTVFHRAPTVSGLDREFVGRIAYASVDKSKLQELLNHQSSTVRSFSTWHTSSLLPYVWQERSRSWVTTQYLPCAIKHPAIDLALFSAPSPDVITCVTALGVQRHQHGDHLARFHMYACRILARFNALAELKSSFELRKNERACLLWAAKGKTSGEISTILDLSEHTINAYLTMAARKLEASSRSHAIAKAIKRGVISLCEID